MKGGLGRQQGPGHQLSRQLSQWRRDEGIGQRSEKKGTEVSSNQWEIEVGGRRS